MKVDDDGLEFKLIMWLSKHQDIKICGRVEVKLHRCLPSALPMISGIRKVGNWVAARGGLDAV
jgi:hypothetical protein